MVASWLLIHARGPLSHEVSVDAHARSFVPPARRSLRGRRFRPSASLLVRIHVRSGAAATLRWLFRATLGKAGQSAPDRARAAREGLTAGARRAGAVAEPVRQ